MEWWEILLTTGLISALVSITFGLWRDRNLETFKGELRKEVFEHETKFASHHDKRAEVISGIHTRIAIAEQRLRRLALPKVPAPRIKGQEASPPYDPIQDASTARYGLENYFIENSLYLSKPQAEMVSEILDFMSAAWVNATTFRVEGMDPEWINSSKQSYVDSFEMIGEIKDSLEASFRETLEA